MRFTQTQQLLILLVIILAGAGVWFVATRQPSATVPGVPTTSTSGESPKPITSPVGFVVARGAGYFDMLDQNRATVRVFVDAKTKVEEGHTAMTVDAIAVGGLVALISSDAVAGGFHADTVNLIPPPPPLKKI